MNESFTYDWVIENFLAIINCLTAIYVNAVNCILDGKKENRFTKIKCNFINFLFSHFHNKNCINMFRLICAETIKKKKIFNIYFCYSSGIAIFFMKNCIWSALCICSHLMCFVFNYCIFVSAVQDNENQ